MRTLLHLSDLHFGRVNANLLEPLSAYARALAPDLVVVSGDLTQRARTRQFKRRATSWTRCLGRRSSCPATMTCRCTTS